jgi:regulator of extracellular matrix RemA (YlzA/DUF370 family)
MCVALILGRHLGRGMKVSESLVGNAQAGGFCPCQTVKKAKVLAAGKQCRAIIAEKGRLTLALTLVDSAVVAVTSASQPAVVAKYYHRISTISTHSNRYSVGTRPYVTQ